jgi:Lon protease-like protein
MVRIRVRVRISVRVRGRVGVRVRVRVRIRALCSRLPSTYQYREGNVGWTVDRRDTPSELVNSTLF